jgi:predicted RNA binding protein YcfA (HicA-like mRNA interferase family)
MSFAPHVWAQLKNLTCDEIIAALKKDGWSQDTGKGSERIYRKPPNRVSIHYHPQKTYGPKMLKGLLDDIGWTEAQMRKLKLIK